MVVAECNMHSEVERCYFCCGAPGRFERPTPALGVLTECKQQEIADNNKSAIHTWTPLAEYSREEKK